MAQKTIHEAFAKFFESPRRDTLRDLLKDQSGELKSCDFKETWPEHGPLSKHFLGLANTGGGCLVVGVKEKDDNTLESVGLAELKDKADIYNGIKYYLPESILSILEVGDYAFDASEYPNLVGKRFQVAFVSPNIVDIPFVARKNGTGIREGAIYIRREGLTEEAGYEQVQSMLEQRIVNALPSTQARHLLEHLEELKVLYEPVARRVSEPAP